MSPSLLRDHPQSDEGVGGAKISGAAARASQGPLGCAIIGRSEAALRDWAAAYITAYRFKWERYAYKATNINNKTGEVSTDVSGASGAPR